MNPALQNNLLQSTRKSKTPQSFFNTSANRSSSYIVRPNRDNKETLLENQTSSSRPTLHRSPEKVNDWNESGMNVRLGNQNPGNRQGGFDENLSIRNRNPIMNNSQVLNQNRQSQFENRRNSFSPIRNDTFQNRDLWARPQPLINNDFTTFGKSANFSNQHSLFQNNQTNDVTADINNVSRFSARSPERNNFDFLNRAPQRNPNDTEQSRIRGRPSPGLNSSQINEMTSDRPGGARSFSKANNMIAVPEIDVKAALDFRLGVFIFSCLVLDYYLFYSFLGLSPINYAKTIFAKIVTLILIDLEIIRDSDRLPFDLFSFVYLRINPFKPQVMTTALFILSNWLALSGVSSAITQDATGSVQTFHSIFNIVLSFLLAYKMLVAPDLNKFQTDRRIMNLPAALLDFIKLRKLADLVFFVIVVSVSLLITYLTTLTNIDFTGNATQEVIIRGSGVEYTSKPSDPNFPDLFSWTVLAESLFVFVITAYYTMMVQYVQWAVYSLRVRELLSIHDNYYEPPCFWLYTERRFENNSKTRVNTITELHCLSAIHNNQKFISAAVINIETKDSTFNQKSPPENSWISFSSYMIESLKELKFMVKQALDAKARREEPRSRNPQIVDARLADSFDSFREHLFMSAPERFVAQFLVNRGAIIGVAIKILIMFTNELYSRNTQSDFRLNPNLKDVTMHLKDAVDSLEKLFLDKDASRPFSNDFQRFSYSSSVNQALKKQVVQLQKLASQQATQLLK